MWDAFTETLDVVRGTLRRLWRKKFGRPRFLYTYELQNVDGVVPSRRPVNEQDFALEIPFPVDELSIPKKIAAVVHAYYPEYVPEILSYLKNVPTGVDLFISTDTPEKIEELKSITAGWDKGSVTIRQAPNRGRDIAPKIVTFSSVYANYEIFIHLHTKRSPHGGAELARWRTYLLHHLLGSTEICRSILKLFEDERLGIVFPQHLFPLRGILNWGYDYDLVRNLLRRIGVAIDKTMVLEFPSGSMFWGRSAAIRPLLDLKLKFEDFPEEAAQIDGTLAHAIERSMLFVCEAAHFEWIKVARKEGYPLPKTVVPTASEQDRQLGRLKVFRPILSAPHSGIRPIERLIPETRKIVSYPSRNLRPRLNLIVPTVNTHQMAGGIQTALRIFEELASVIPGRFDRRLIATDAAIRTESYSAFPDYVLTRLCASLDEHPATIVDAFEREDGELDLRREDYFVATAWWTAMFADDLTRDAARFFGAKHPYIYLVQDEEPHFYGWSSRWALAEKTYSDNVIAVINSEELYDRMVSEYAFSKAFCIDYKINSALQSFLAPVPRERIILVYGRPHVQRNTYEVVADGIFLWQQRNPLTAAKWNIVSVGEPFASHLTDQLQNFRIAGKLSLKGYADYLSKSLVGLSMMISPHPSYPPLEMAEAGLAVIANDYPGKAMKKRSPAIKPVQVTGEEIARALETATEAMEPHVGKILPRRKIKPIGGRRRQIYSAGRVIAALDSASS